MQLNSLLEMIKTKPSEIEFQDVMSVIDSHYSYSPQEFVNGIGNHKVINAAGTNEGSCKLFAFAYDQGLTQQQTLECFGRYYREDVLLHPKNTDHANIRNFIEYGWKGIHFSSPPLIKNTL